MTYFIRNFLILAKLALLQLKTVKSDQNFEVEEMASKKTGKKEDPLPLPALRLLVPPVRLVSAAMWKVMKDRDVMHYGTLEEFVTSSCETAPGLLTYRHQAKLGLGLRGRLILEMCRGQDPPDPEDILPHLERIRAPVVSPTATTMKRDIKIETIINTFRDFVQSLLKDPEEREHFFKGEFVTEYGAQFDLELEKLLWEFLVRLDQLLPVPSLAQTVSSWLSAAPSGQEGCAEAASQHQLNTLLQHHIRGHVEPAASLPPCMGDSILTSLSLPPSGRVVKNTPSVAQTPRRTIVSPGTKQSTSSLPFIKPVIGLMCNKDLPIMSSARRRTGTSPDSLPAPGDSESTGSSKYTRLKLTSTCAGNGVREDDGGVEDTEMDVQMENERQHELREQTRDGRSESTEKEARVTRRGIKRRRNMEEELKELPEENNRDDEEEKESITDRERVTKESLKSDRMATFGTSASKPMDDQALSSLVKACLHSRPVVLLQRLNQAVCAPPPSTSTLPYQSSRIQAGKSPRGQDKRLKMTRTRTRDLNVSDMRHDGEPPELADKENCALPTVAGSSPSSQARNSGEVSPKSGDDIIVDSEDEATKNFKGRLFVKRYYRTKHNTFVPTLREFWRPGMARRDLLSPGNGHR